MSSIEVVVKGSLLGEDVRIRPYVTKATDHTRISTSLANRLGLTECRSIFIAAAPNGIPCEWKISVFPIKIWCHGMQERRSLSVYPIINTNFHGAFYEMILGRDSFQQLKNIVNHTKCFNNETQPTPGRAFCSERKCHVPFDIVPLVKLPRVNAFFEYDCSESTSVFRLALNKVSRQLIVIYRSGGTVYCYLSLSKRHEIAIERGESKGEIMSEVKVACHCKEIETFPAAALVEPRFGVSMLT